MGDVEIVFFHVETTGFAKDEEIIQIAACSQDTTFNIYITPNKPIDCRASEVNGFTLKGNKLFLNGVKVHSVRAAYAFEEFLDYLKDFRNNVILVAHNCFGFHMPRILELALELGDLEEFEDVVNGFSDSLVILKDILKDQRSGKGSFTFEALIRDYLGENSSHLNKAELLLQLLFNSALGPISEEQIVQSSKTVQHYFDKKQSKLQIEKAKDSLEYFSNILPYWVINKMAKANIDQDLLRETYQEDGFEGIRNLFTQNYYGKPRVTSNTYIIQNLCNCLHNDMYCQCDTEVSDDTEASADAVACYDTDSSSDYYY